MAVYKSMKINNFRIFKNQNIIFGKLVTVFCGRNSTGKSTLLGMVANSGEFKKADGSTYFKKPFRAEFGEIFKGSERFDSPGSDRFSIIIVDAKGNKLDSCSFRTSWQATNRARMARKKLKESPNDSVIDGISRKELEKQSKEKRFRIIPDNKNKESPTEAKFKYPIQYLGLSRLFPIGESRDVVVNDTGIQFLNQEHRQWFINNYISILSIQSELKEIDDISIKETEKKIGVGVTTDSYDYFTNSSGQDNLGQILLALLSFKKLKELQCDSWNGGVLLIDEIDATLHPAAQRDLLKLLIKEARSTGIQIIFTTHSLSLLGDVCSRIIHNKNDDNYNNDIELYYLTCANRSLKVKRSLSFSEIENDLTLTAVGRKFRRIKLYSEDEEARWFIRQILGDLAYAFDFVDINIGCNELIRLCRVDSQYFGNVLIVLDGDVKEEQLKCIPNDIRNSLGNIVLLVGGKRPEEVIYDYIINLDENHDFWKDGEKLGLTYDYFKNRGPNYEVANTEREKYKIWFNNHKDYFEQLKLIEYWKIDNKELANGFIVEIEVARRKLESRMMIIKS